MMSFICRPTRHGHRHRGTYIRPLFCFDASCSVSFCHRGNCSRAAGVSSCAAHLPRRNSATHQNILHACTPDGAKRNPRLGLRERGTGSRPQASRHRPRRSARSLASRSHFHAAARYLGEVHRLQVTVTTSVAGQFLPTQSLGVSHDGQHRGAGIASLKSIIPRRARTHLASRPRVSSGPKPSPGNKALPRPVSTV
jgi:hypothetical protein